MTRTTHIRFTETEISALPVTDKRTRWHDTQMPGLVLDVTTGKKAFRVYKKLAGRETPLSVTLGDFPALTVESARRLARKAMADMADGINPNDSKRQFRAASVKLSEVFQRFLEQRDLKDTTLRGYQQLMKCYLSDWQQKRMADISEDMVYKRHQKLSQSSRAQADYTMRTVRALFNFAKVEYKDPANRTLFPVNPVVVLSEKRAWNNVARRQTRLRPSQLTPFLQAINTLRDEAIAYRQDFTVAVCDYVEFTAYTGLRRTELLDLKWQDVYLKDELFILRDTKNHDDLELPITGPLKAILLRRKEYKITDFVFGADNRLGRITEPKKVIQKINEQAGISFTLHDLRRTYCSIAESLGIGTYTIKRLLNHKTGRNDVTAGYTVLTAEELKEPAQRIVTRINQYAGIDVTKPCDMANIKNIISGLSKEQKLSLLAELVV